MRSRVEEVFADRFQVLDEAGRGDVSVVYHARALDLGRDVALKVLRPELARPVATERFLREIRIAAHLVHPNIVPLIEAGDAGGFLFHVTPWVNGETLRRRLEREKMLPVAEAVGIALELLDALGYAHARGVVHRDIKPANVLLAEGHALLVDFGVAKAVEAGSGERLTATGVVVGTPWYMSPEQAAGEEEVDARSDLYSVACLLCEMLSGTPPFGNSSATQTMRRRQSESPPCIRDVRQSVPPETEAALMRALQRIPADRPQSAAAFAEALRGDASATKPAGGQDSATGGRITFWQELRRRKVGNVGAVYLGALIVFFDVGPDRFLELLGLDVESWSRTLEILAIAGFPVALLLAWTFEVTREGRVRRTGEWKAVASGRGSRKWPLVTRGSLTVLALLGFFWLVWHLFKA